MLPRWATGIPDVVPTATNIHGYVERSFLPLMREVDKCKEEIAFDKLAIDNATLLIDELEKGLI